MSVKLYVGNLPYSTQEEDLKTLFTQAGNVISVALIRDKFNGRSKGFAFVEMEEQDEADKAINMFNGYELEQRELKVNVARPREERPRGGGRPDRDRRGGSERY